MIDAMSLSQRTEAAASVVASHAEDVDLVGRFPVEAIGALKESRLLGLLVPTEFDGPGAPLGEVLRICRRLGQVCGSTALVYAMHQIQVACLLGCSPRNAWQGGFLRRVAAEQLLLASVTSEVGVGGDIRSSLCAPAYDGDRLVLTKHSSAISYGEHADALLVTARRDGDAASSDQVLIVAERADVSLAETGRWNTLGMRGTDSRAFDVQLSAASTQIVERSFSDIAQHTMLPVSHILWGGVWLGIANDAAERARAFLRRQTGGTGGATLGHARFGKMASLLATMRSVSMTRCRLLIAMRCRSASCPRSTC